MNKTYLISYDNLNNYQIINLPVSTLKDIDSFTSKFKEEELVEYLYINKLINKKDINLFIKCNNYFIYDIIYSNNFCDNKALYIINFIKYYKNNRVVFELLSKIKNNNNISIETKNYFDSIINQRIINYDILNYIYKEILLFDYLELRIIYLIIKEDLEKLIYKLTLKK